MGKVWLVLIREIFIFRFELIVVVIFVKFSYVIWDELDLIVNKVIYWIDFILVLKCINNEIKRFYIFELNCLIIIYDGFIFQQWCYVNREDNLVDDGFKGLKLDVLIKNNCWLIGFKFLWEEEECWLIVVEILIFKDDDLEVRKEN